MNMLVKGIYILIFVANILINLYILIKIIYLKFVCSKSVEATITNMELAEHSRHKKYIPTLTYTYKGITYNTKSINGFVYGPNVLDERLGSKTTIKIDENNPSHIYTTNLGLTTLLNVMLIALSLVILITVILYT